MQRREKSEIMGSSRLGPGILLDTMCDHGSRRSSGSPSVRRPMVPGPGDGHDAKVPIRICDSHGDALFYWRETHAGRPRSVLHLDSHADMMTNWSNQIWTDAGPGWTAPSREALAERVAGQVDLANFQPSAVFQGLVDAIVWLRSDFALGQYNGPAPGHYRPLLAMPDYAVEGREPDPIIGDGAQPLLTCFHVSGESFCEYGPRLAHEAGRGARQRRPRVPVERNTLWDKGWECTRPPLERLSAAFDYSVVTLEQLAAPHAGVLEEVRRRMKVGSGGSEWILDVDLDCGVVSSLPEPEKETLFAKTVFRVAKQDRTALAVVLGASEPERGFNEDVLCDEARQSRSSISRLFRVRVASGSLLLARTTSRPTPRSWPSSSGSTAGRSRPARRSYPRVDPCIPCTELLVVVHVCVSE